MKKILVTGGDGRFASELKKIKTNIKFIYLNKKRLDICNFKSIIKAIKKYKPKTILHLAGLSRPMDIHESNISKRVYFTDYRHNGYFIKTIKLFNNFFGHIHKDGLLYKFIRKLFHRNIFFSINEKNKIKNYFKNTKL